MSRKESDLQYFPIFHNLDAHVVFHCFAGVGAVGRVRRVTYRLTGQHYALKCMSIAEVQQRKQKVHTKQEKDILLEITHPFIVDL